MKAGIKRTLAFPKRLRKNDFENDVGGNNSGFGGGGEVGDTGVFV